MGRTRRGPDPSSDERSSILEKKPIDEWALEVDDLLAGSKEVTCTLRARFLRVIVQAPTDGRT